MPSQPALVSKDPLLSNSRENSWSAPVLDVKEQAARPQENVFIYPYSHDDYTRLGSQFGELHDRNNNSND